MIAGFSFMDADRTFDCSVERRGGSAGPRRWWWFVVTGDGHRYAPFRADDDDTESSVRYRIVAYYDDLTERRERLYGRYTR